VRYDTRLDDGVDAEALRDGGVDDETRLDTRISMVRSASLIASRRGGKG
jgi:hypothetical protein